MTPERNERTIETRENESVQGSRAGFRQTVLKKRSQVNTKSPRSEKEDEMSSGRLENKDLFIE